MQNILPAVTFLFPFFTSVGVSIVPWYRDTNKKDPVILAFLAIFMDHGMFFLFREKVKKTIVNIVPNFTDI